MKRAVSTPQELDDFLAENPDLSCSKMLQSKIMEIRTNRRQIFAETDRLKKHALFLNKKLEEAGEKNVVLEKEVIRLDRLLRTEERDRPDLVRN